MADPLTQQDSPLSIVASIAGILTFVYALAASVIGYIYLYRSSSPDSIERFYEAFSACALETDLVRRDILQAGKTGDPAGLAETHPDRVWDLPKGPALDKDALSVSTKSRISPDQDESFYGSGNPIPAADNYLLDPDSLGRLYEQVRTVEIELQNQAARVVRANPSEDSRNLLERFLGRGRWASRAKELEESLAKREQLTSRLLVIQMSLMSARTRTLHLTVERMQKQIKSNEIGMQSLKDQIMSQDYGP
ncbi:hypothetical protein MMC10_004360 [Thelotrema lepadinum]|nr:hypothetical protein [Thelotrema lepadinum]